MNRILLYLVQHGEATSEEVDPKRPLTEKGRRDSLKTARFLKNADLEVDTIWHSTKERSKETASIFAKELSLKQSLLQKEKIGPKDPIVDVADDIGSLNENVMIVGHLPFLQRLASLLLLETESYEILQFKKGGVVCLERDEEGVWRLVFEVIPGLLK
jgi:phosphohistidine phosphatase